MTEIDPLSKFGISSETVEERTALFKAEGYDRDGRICICGHPMKRHNTDTFPTTCTPSRLQCPCKKARPVIEVSDTRRFLKKTRGSGPDHALILGIHSANKAGDEIKYLSEPTCDAIIIMADGTRIQCESVGFAVPTVVSKSGIVINDEIVEKDGPTGYDVFLCEKCRGRI